MSFGFSIGDIILLSQLSYQLYSSVSSGRRAASRGLKELEEVLFSLKCALDHLGEVANDVLAQPGFRHGGSGLKEKLDVMINSCASTLKELESATEKYRLVENEAKAKKGKIKMQKLDEVKRSIQVNWQRVRWDYEKQSLQQYREKLKSHTDAINLMLTSVIWANTAITEESSKRSHEKTHFLLEEILRNPQADTSLPSTLRDMHSAFKRPSPSIGESSTSIGFRGGQTSNMPILTAYAMASTRSAGTPGLSTDDAGFSPSVPSVLAYKSSAWPSEKVENLSLRRRHWTPDIKHEQPSSGKPERLSRDIADLNNKRRAFGAKEYEAFVERHSQPKKKSKPSFLTAVTPNKQELQDCVAYIFQATPDGKQQTQELRSEIERWTQGFCLLINGMVPGAESDENLLALLTTLNEAVEKSTGKAQQLFYEVSSSAGFEKAVDQVLSISKSVRVTKEIEEFQDAKEESEA